MKTFNQETTHNGNGHCPHPAPFDGKPAPIQVRPMRYRYPEYCCICGQRRNRVYVRQKLQGHGQFLHPSQKLVFREVDPWEDSCPGPGNPEVNALPAGAGGTQA